MVNNRRRRCRGRRETFLEGKLIHPPPPPPEPWALPGRRIKTGTMSPLNGKSHLSALSHLRTPKSIQSCSLIREKGTSKFSSVLLPYNVCANHTHVRVFLRMCRRVMMYTRRRRRRTRVWPIQGPLGRRRLVVQGPSCWKTRLILMPPSPAPKLHARTRENSWRRRQEQRQRQQLQRRQPG